MTINFEDDKQEVLTGVDEANALSSQVLKLKNLEDLYFKKKKPCLLLVNKNLSFDSSFKGDFNLQDGMISRDNNNEFIFSSEIKAIIAANPYFNLCYNPFFIAMGTTMRDFLHPEFILFGNDDDWALNKAKKFYKTITHAPVFETTIENAELIKVVYKPGEKTDMFVP